MFLKQLGEKLEAQKMYDGMMGKYETRFKVEGTEYAFLATSVGGDYYDNTEWMLEFENIKSHRIGAGDNNKAVAKAFAEAVDGWVKEKNPMSFYTYGSSLESLQNIIEAVKKKVKKYNLIDNTAERKNEENGEVIEGNPVGKITWSKVLEAEVVPTEDREALVGDEFEEPFEEPKDIKTDKAHMSGTKKTDKLDKGDKAYDLKTEGVVNDKVEQYYKKYQDKMKDASKETLEGWVKGIGRALSDEDKNKLRKKIGIPEKKTESFVEFKTRMLSEAEEVNIADTDLGVGQGMKPEQNKNNVLRFFAMASDDMKEIVSTSERNPYDKKIIEMSLDSALASLNQLPAEEFEGLQKYTGDKEPDFMSKQVFKAIQSVIGSQEDSITGGKPINKAEGQAAVAALADSMVEKVQSVLKGGFQKSAVLNTGKKSSETPEDYIMRSIKDLG